MEKIIHYCWFGNKKMDDQVICCIKSWQEMFPDYKIQLWNEHNFDIKCCDYVKEAYNQKQYAFVTDYVRLYALYNYGGIYFDTDYEVLNNFEHLLHGNIVLGFENEDMIQTAMIFAKKKHDFIKNLMMYYEDAHFINGVYVNNKTNVRIITEFLKSYGLKSNGEYQLLKDIEIYPSEIFCPIDFNTGKIHITENTVGIHNFNGSWLDIDQKVYFKNKRQYGKVEAKKRNKNKLNKRNIGLQYSIIITYYDKINILNSCLHALSISLRNRQDYEIIIVNDNAKHILTHSSLKYDGSLISISIINNEFNKGYSGACNIGAQSANGDCLIFIDSDIMVSENWLIEMEKTAQNHPNFGAVSAKILSLTQGKIEYFGMLLYEVDSIKPKYGFRDISLYTAQDKEFSIVTSGCMMIRKSVFDDVYGFDEALYNSHCDLDLSLKLAPRKNYVCASAIVYHRGSTSGDIRHISYVKARSAFFKKWANYNMNQIALSELFNMYSEYSYTISTKYFKVFNFSTTRYSEVYLRTLEMALDIHIVSCIDIRNISQDTIILNDILDCTIAHSSIAIIYFVDNYELIIKNLYWFSERNFCKDLIVDWNGNIISVCELI